VGYTLFVDLGDVEKIVWTKINCEIVFRFKEKT